VRKFPFRELTVIFAAKRLSSELSEVFHCIILVSDGNGGARIGQGKCRARTVFKIDFELSPGFMD